LNLRVAITELLLMMVVVVAPAPLAHAQGAVFVSSSSGNSNLSGWDSASEGVTGLAAADSICVNLATAAELSNPGNFVAWLSDSTDDAYCRVHGLSGKKSAKCGELELPTGAGPWVRTDGLPFAPAAPDFLGPDGIIYAPLIIDENGSKLPVGTPVWTGSYEGALIADHCNNWDGPPPVSDTTYPGIVDRTTFNWEQYGNQGCGVATTHIYCFEKITGPALVLPNEPGRLAFLTSRTGTGDLSSWEHADEGKVGIEAGDSICNNLADLAGLPNSGSYKAWLSDGTTDARDRFAEGGAWVRTDGLKIADSKADLLDGELLASINLDDTNHYRGIWAVWTGTNADGTANANHCGNWQSTAGNGRTGRSNTVSAGWTADQSGVSNSCNFMSARLYCLSDFVPELEFEDGFE